MKKIVVGFLLGMLFFSQLQLGIVYAASGNANNTVDEGLNGSQEVQEDFNTGEKNNEDENSLEKGIVVIITDKQLEIFDSIEEDRKLIGTIVLKEPILVYPVENENAWYSLSIDGKKGYVSAENVSIVKNEKVLDDLIKENETNKEDQTKKVNISVQENLPLIVDKNENSEVFMFVEKGQQITLYRFDESWLYTYVAGHKVYVSTEKVDTMLGTKKPEQNEESDNHQENESLNENTFNESTESTKSVQQRTNEKTSELNEELVQQKIDLNSSNKVNQLAISSVKSVQTNSVRFSSSDKFFKVTAPGVNVYVKENGALKKIGQLENGQVYPRVAGAGNWHQIDFSGEEAFVYETSTVPDNGSSLRNLANSRYPNAIIQTKVETPVYESRDGKLIKFGSLLEGVKLQAFKRVGNWWEVDVFGRTGYIYINNVSILNQSAKYFKVTADVQYVYIPRENGMIRVAQLTKGQIYPKTGEQGNWHQIDLNGVKGFVYKNGTTPIFNADLRNEDKNSSKVIGKFISLKPTPIYDNTSGKLVQFGTFNPNIEYRIIGESGDWWKVSFLDRIGYIYKANVKRSFASTDKYFRVLTDVLNVYYSTSNGLKKEGELLKNQIYKIEGRKGDWFVIYYAGKTGYVWSPSTAPASANSSYCFNVPSTNRKLDVKTVTKTPVYYKNNCTSDNLIQFGYLEEGITNVRVINIYGNWLQIAFGGRTGYIYKFSTNLEFTKIQSYDSLFSEALQKQIAASPQIASSEINGYILSTAFKSIQDGYGIVSGNNWNIRSGPGTKYTQLNATTSNGYLINNEKVKILSSEIVYNSTTKKMETWYEIDYRNTWRLNSNGDYVAHKRGPVTYWVMAPPKQVEYYLNPNNFKNHAVQKFQFLDLSSPANISVTELNKVLAGEGILEGKGKSFEDAAKKYSINEIYLIAHAILETGHGRSELANGIYVDKVDGKSVPGKTVYNMYGIGAYDGCAKTCGAERAYKEGWFTPEAAIVGGAKFIGQGYIHNGQNTLYKMRWNPANPGTHQYATDVRWAYNQVYDIYNLYQKMDNYTLTFEIPQYR